MQRYRCAVRLSTSQGSLSGLQSARGRKCFRASSVEVLSPSQEHREPRAILHADGEALDLRHAPVETIPITADARLVRAGFDPKLRPLCCIEARPASELDSLGRAV